MISQQVEILTADGTIGALLVRTDTTETLPGVILLTDGLGFRQRSRIWRRASPSAATRC